MEEYLYKELTSRIISGFYKIYNELGFGFLEKVIIELKAAESLIHEHELQLINCLKATEIEVGLLLNFGKKQEIRRKIFSNQNL